MSRGFNVERKQLTRRKLYGPAYGSGKARERTEETKKVATKEENQAAQNTPIRYLKQKMLIEGLRSEKNVRKVMEVLLDLMEALLEKDPKNEFLPAYQIELPEYFLWWLNFSPPTKKAKLIFDRISKVFQNEISGFFEMPKELIDLGKQLAA